jgi:hypothetical protein
LQPCERIFAGRFLLSPSGLCSRSDGARTANRILCERLGSTHAMRNLPVATSFGMPVTGSWHTRIALRLNPMIYNLKNGGAPDRSRINMNDQHEVRHWTEMLGCSKEELAAAVARVGNSSDAVRREVYRAWAYGTVQRDAPEPRRRGRPRKRA